MAPYVIACSINFPFSHLARSLKHLNLNGRFSGSERRIQQCFYGSAGATHICYVRDTALVEFQDSYLNEENEAEDARAWFPCPFCYVDIEVPMLCSHLQDEHCFDLKNAVCPICAATLGKDPTGHFSVQHAHLVKRRRNYLKPDFWNNATAMIGKDTREIASFFGANSVFGRYKVQESAPDPLLLPFLCNFPPPDPKCRQQDKSSVCATATTQIESSKLAVSEPALEEHFEEKRQRAAFLQELVASTIF